jgi:membrane protease YdiL (CAAX protease family)
MHRAHDIGYHRAVCHPVCSVAFVLPLLAIYELGVWLIGGHAPERLRNGADVWLRYGLAEIGLPWNYSLPLLLGVVLLLWAWAHRHSCPPLRLNHGLGMVVESLAYAVLLGMVSLVFGPLLDGLSVLGSVPPRQPVAVGQVVTFLGAGIYEEFVFRLVLFSCILGLLRLCLIERWLAWGLALLGSALLFAAAHHVGPHGERMDSYVFFFRTFAGVYFALVYQLRGFGVAVGTHAGYDVLVGVSFG